MEEGRRLLKSKGPIVGLLAISAGATAAWAAWTWYSTRDEIPVVRTHGDLRARDPIVLKDGTKVWIGKEAASCPVGSGVLVYVLAEGASTQSYSRRSSDQVGPIRVRARREELREALEESRLAMDGLEPASSWLFTRRFDLTQPGRLRIEALTIEGELLRVSHIRGDSAEYHPWMLWGQWHNGVGPDGLVPGCVLPRGPDECVVPAKPGTALPRLFPEGDDPAITIARTTTGISVQSAEEMWIYRGMHLFLVRFWVNGRPFMPGRLDGWSEGGIGIHHVKSLELKLDLPWIAIDARPGDRIGLEVLYCPHGCSPVSDGVQALEAPSTTEARGWPRLSNRLEFTAQ